MDPIHQTSSSSSEPSVISTTPSDTEFVKSALTHLSEHKEKVSFLSKPEFTRLQSNEKTSELFQRVFGLAREQCSYDKALELRLEELAKLSPNNQKAKERIVEFLQSSSQNTLNLGSFSLMNLPKIWQHTAFTSRLQSLDLRNNRLTSLPDSFGNLLQLQKLYLYNNQFTSFPENIFQLHSSCEIDITECPFSARLLQALQGRIQRTDYQGPRITYSHHESNPSSKSTKELLQELFQTAQREPKDFPELETNKDLRDWLNRLSNMANYKAGGDHRKHLATTTLNILETANSGPVFRGVFFTVIEEATQTCGDRMALSLLHLGIQYKMTTMSKNDPKEVATFLIRGPMILNLLAEITQKKVASMKFVDPIEVYLAYPVRLQQELKISIDVKEMRYFSWVTEEEFTAAKKAVKEVLANRESLYQYLIRRDAWITTLTNAYSNEITNLKEKRSDNKNYVQAEQEFQEDLSALTRKALEEWNP